MRVLISRVQAQRLSRRRVFEHLRRDFTRRFLHSPRSACNQPLHSPLTACNQPTRDAPMMPRKAPQRARSWARWSRSACSLPTTAPVQQARATRRGLLKVSSGTASCMMYSSSWTLDGCNPRLLSGPAAWCALRPSFLRSFCSARARRCCSQMGAVRNARDHRRSRCSAQSWLAMRSRTGAGAPLRPARCSTYLQGMRSK